MTWSGFKQIKRGERTIQALVQSLILSVTRSLGVKVHSKQTQTQASEQIVGTNKSPDEARLRAVAPMVAARVGPICQGLPIQWLRASGRE